MGKLIKVVSGNLKKLFYFEIKKWGYTLIFVFFIFKELVSSGNRFKELVSSGNRFQASKSLFPLFSKFWNFLPIGNCMFKVNNRSTRTRCKICSKLTIKTQHSTVFELKHGVPQGSIVWPLFFNIRNYDMFYFIDVWELREKYPNTKFFLVRIFRSKSPYSVQIRENTDQKKLRIWTLFTQWGNCKLRWWHSTVHNKDDHCWCNIFTWNLF